MPPKTKRPKGRRGSPRTPLEDVEVLEEWRAQNPLIDYPRYTVDHVAFYVIKKHREDNLARLTEELRERVLKVGGLIYLDVDSSILLRSGV